MKISIVTISYNQAPFLEQAILSVLNQDYPDIEYIVVDAGSTDGSRDIIEKYRPRISKVIFEPDEGPADGLNKGFGQATGDIFGYINADDYFEPGSFGYVEKYFLDHPEADVLSGSIRMVHKDGSPKLRNRISDKFTLKRFTSGLCTVGQQATFFRSDAYKKASGFNIENRTSWDGELLVDMALAGCSFRTVYKILGNFRIYGDSITGSGTLRAQNMKNRYRMIQKIKSSGVALFPLWVAMILRLLYKINPLRHFLYIYIR